jgi:hypothetical protein
VVCSDIREWAVIAIRNLCENSPEVQAEIAKLTPTGVENTPELNEMQINVQLDAQTGRVRVGPRKDNEPPASTPPSE